MGALAASRGRGGSEAASGSPPVPYKSVPLLLGPLLLGRTLLYTVLTRARRLVVLVGQCKALSMAVRDWRRAPRYTALGGLLDETLRFAWPRDAAAPDEEEARQWEGLSGLDAEA